MKVHQEIRIFAACLLLAVLNCMFCKPTKADDAITQEGVLSLVNGDAFSGQLNPSDSGDRVSWKNDQFLDPFSFHTGAIESIRFPARLKYKPQDPFVIQCVDGDVLTGDIIEVDEEKLVLESTSLGEIAVRTSSLRSIHRLRSGETSLVTFATGLSDWNAPGFPTENWNDQGEFLSTDTRGAVLNGDFSIPTRAVIDFELAWDGKPDFVFAIATDAKRDTDSNTDGWRLETSNGQLIVVRETESSADTDIVRDLSKSQSIRLLGYLDQQTGALRLHLQTGEQLAEVQITKAQIPNSAEMAVAADDHSGTQGGIRVINRGKSLRISRLQITPWLANRNDSPQRMEAEERKEKSPSEPVQISDSGGKIASGKIRSFDKKTKSLQLVDGKKSFTVRLTDLVSIQFAKNRPPSTHPESVFRLRAGTQVSGNVVRVSQKNWLIKGGKYIDPTSIPRSEVHHLSFHRLAENSEEWDAKLGTDVDGHRIGRIELGTSRHLGWIASEEEDVRDPNSSGEPNISRQSKGASAISWRPLASENSCRLRPDASGRIVYDEGSLSNRLGRSMKTSRNTRTVRRTGDRNFGKLFLESVDRVESRRARRDQHVVHLTSGDVIACRVESIAESGVIISTLGQDNTLVAHNDMKAIELLNNSDLPKISDAKKDRLLTLPRLQKSSPPTHILCSSDGDLLRGRLIRASESTIEVEVQMEILTIARQRVSHIIWLHPKQMGSDSLTEDRYIGLVQALWFDQRRLTFAPKKTSETNIEGSSEILGDCNVELDKVVQLAFGRQIERESTKLMYSNWKLSDAIQPLIMQTGENTDSDAESSELVGRAAPRIVLEQLDGGSFDLDTCRGRVVVLNFWASWSAPCIRWIPELHKTIATYDPAKVTLVGINLEERPEVASDALNRLGIRMVVALDVDGETSGPYQASEIPQTVVVGPTGKVVSVIVGGRNSAAEKVKNAIDQSIDSKR